MPETTADGEISRTIDLPDGRILVRARGRGPPVAYLHGISAHGVTWLPVARRLADRARCWIPDLLSRGRSSIRPDLPYGLDDEARRMRAVLWGLADREGLPFPAVLIGHSQGAAIALAVAARAPEVRGLVLASPVTPWTRRPAALAALRPGICRRAVATVARPAARPIGRFVLRRAAGPRFRIDPEALGAYLAPYRDPERIEALLRALADWRPAELGERLPDRALEVRVLVGSLDPRIRVEHAERLARALGTAAEVIPDGGHVLPEQCADLIAHRVTGVLDTVGDPGP